jgi:hypothetical protein
MRRSRLLAAGLIALLGCARGEVGDEASRGGKFLAAVERARAGGPEMLMPLLMAAIDGRMGDFDGKLAARLLWEQFPDDAPAITDAKISSVSDRTAFALAEQQSHAGKLTPAGKQVLDKHMCAKLESGRWGVLLTKMKPENEGDLMNAELNDVSYACDGSPAARSGLRPGDTILLIDGERVRGDEVLARFREKSRATLHVRRAGREQDIVIAR